MIRSALHRCIDFVTDHNRITLLVMVLLTGLVLAGIPMIDTASQAGGTSAEFDDIDRVQKAQYIESAYGNASDRSNTTVETVYVRQADGNVLSKESLLDGLRYQQGLRENDSVSAALRGEGMRGLSNLVAVRAAGDENADLSTQVAALEAASESEVRDLVSQTLANDPRAARFLPTDHDAESPTSTDRRMLVVLTTDVDGDTQDAASAAIYESASERSEAGFFVVNNHAWAEYNTHFFGEMTELVLPAALVLILLVLAVTYRDLVDVVVGMVGVVLSVLWTFGLLGWLGVQAGNISIVPVVLVTGLSIDFGFHVFNRYREQRGEDEGIRTPMARGVRLVGTALVLVTITAAIGFMANVVNPMSTIRDLGISITLGVVSALVIFLTVVPALKIGIDGLLERVGLDRRKRALGHGSYLRPALSGSVTLARRAAPLVILVAVVVGAVGGVAWLELDEESYQQSDGEVAEWKQQLPDPIGWETDPFPERANHVEEAYQPASSDAAFQSRILVEGEVTADGTLEDVSAGVEQVREGRLLVDQPGTQAVGSPVTAMQSLAERDKTFATAFEEADTDGDGVPDSNLESLYDAFYEADADLARSVVERNDDEYTSLLVTLTLDAGWADASDVVPRLDDAAAVMAGDGDRTGTAAGQLAINEAVLDSIVEGILLTMAIALVAIVLALTGAFRLMHGSASLGAVVAVPIALVVGMVIGGMYLLEIPLTLLTALLMSLVIGLGVDYNIHIGDRFADELHEGRDAVDALRTAVTGTGGALLGSTLTSAGAFATIALVPHPQLQSFGAIVVVALLTSFVVSVLVLPSGLLLWSRYRTIPEAGTVAGPDAEAAAQD